MEPIGEAVSIDPDDPIMHALIERVVKRTAEKRIAEALPLRRQLPGSKAEFPKLLCLDQNKWVDLEHDASALEAPA